MSQRLEKTCSKCGVTKPAAAFATRGRGLLSSHCRECVKVENRDYYANNQARLSAEAKERARQKTWTADDRARRPSTSRTMWPTGR